ncbi:MAG: hypothetical protein ACRDHZ_12840 [Ktedonobacteraceae bacterium]
MIIRCIHLREAGVMKGPCCSSCHDSAGCVGEMLPGGHQAVYCCTRTEPFTSEDIRAILAHVSKWETLRMNPAYHKKLRSMHKKLRSQLHQLEQLMSDVGITLGDFEAENQN